MTDAAPDGREASAAARMQRRVDRLADVLFETDAEGRLLYVNGAWARVMAQPAEAAIGRHLVAFLAPADVPVVLQRMRAVEPTEDAERLPVRMLRADGTQRWIALSLTPMPEGGHVGMLQDVTRQKQQQDEWRQQSLVAVHTECLVIITDAAGGTEWVNRAFTERTGYTLDDMRGRKPGTLLQGPETDRGTVRRIGEAVRAGRSIRASLMNYTSAGERYWVALQITPIRDASGVVCQYVAVQSDAFERPDLRA